MAVEVVKEHNDSIIELQEVCFAYPGSERLILDHLNLSIRENDRIGIMAPNGAGKTTLLHSIMGLCRPNSGTIRIFGREMKTEKDFSPIRSRIGLLFQDSDDQLFCPTVLDDVAFGPLNLGLSRQEAVERARQTLARFGLDGFENTVTHRMSGGQKRMVALAAVMAMKPEVLLLDEPTAGLDMDIKEKLIKILDDLNVPFLIISHEFDFISAVTPKIFSMENGRILTDEEVHIHQHLHVHKHGKHPHIHK